MRALALIALCALVLLARDARADYTWDTTAYGSGAFYIGNNPSPAVGGFGYVGQTFTVPAGNNTLLDSFMMQFYNARDGEGADAAHPHAALIKFKFQIFSWIEAGSSSNITGSPLFEYPSSDPDDVEKMPKEPTWYTFHPDLVLVPGQTYAALIKGIDFSDASYSYGQQRAVVVDSSAYFYPGGSNLFKYPINGVWMRGSDLAFQMHFSLPEPVIGLLVAPLAAALLGRRARTRNMRPHRSTAVSG